MLKANKFLVIIALFFFVVIMGSCGGGGGGSGGGGQGGTTVGPNGGVIEVTDPSNLLYGLKVEIPAGALRSSVNIDVEAYDGLIPLPPGINTSATIIKLTPEGLTFDKLVTITIPYIGNEVPIIVSYNQSSNSYEVLPIVDIDQNNKKAVVITNHFSLIGRVIVSLLGDVTTGFNINEDTFMINNTLTDLAGTPASLGGACWGFSVYSKWYYENKKNTDGNLINKYGCNEKWVVSDAMDKQLDKWRDVFAMFGDVLISAYGVYHPLVAKELYLSLLLTKKPQVLALKENFFTEEAHAVLVYGASCNLSGCIFDVYENQGNPKRETVRYDTLFNYRGYNLFVYLGAETFINKDDMQEVYNNYQNRPCVGTISGSVKDAVTRTPLQSVSIDVYSGSLIISSGATDSSGVYSFQVPSGSGYTVKFSKTGYIPAIYENVSVEANTTRYLETVLQIDTTYSGTGNVSGKIVNALDGTGVGGLSINLRAGINVTTGLIVATTTTQSGGFYSFRALNAGYYTAEVSGSGYNTTYFTVICIGGMTTANQDATITPILSSGETRIILTWGATPSDLDSHLTGPLPDGTRFHMYWWHAELCESGCSGYGSPWPEYVKLDKDDTSSYGPETATVYQQISGTYRYSVHDFTNRWSSYSTALSNSGAQVRVYRGSNLVETFNVPSNQEGTLWTVFELSGDAITPINTMSYESYSSDIQSVSLRRTITTDAELIRNLPPKR
jgi:hypothetical protein